MSYANDWKYDRLYLYVHVLCFSHRNGESVFCCCCLSLGPVSVELLAAAETDSDREK